MLLPARRHTHHVKLTWPAPTTSLLLLLLPPPLLLLPPQLLLLLLLLLTPGLSAARRSYTFCCSQKAWI
jgi:hypothetical protein